MATVAASGSWQRYLSLSGWCLGPLAFLPVVIKTSPAAVFTALLPITDASGWNLGHYKKHPDISLPPSPSPRSPDPGLELEPPEEGGREVEGAWRACWLSGPLS